MGGGVAEEVSGISGVDDLLEDEVLLLKTGGEGLDFTRLVAWEESGTLSDSVVVGSPHELDGVANRGVYSEGDETKDTLLRGDDDGVDNTISTSAASGTSSGGGRSVRMSAGLGTVLGDTLGNTVIVVRSPLGATRAVGWFLDGLVGWGLVGNLSRAGVRNGLGLRLVLCGGLVLRFLGLVIRASVGAAIGTFLARGASVRATI
jgi:hypothetical protein